MSRVNIVKRIKIDGLWKMLSIPEIPKATTTGMRSPTAVTHVEWYVGGTAHNGCAGCPQVRCANQTLHCPGNRRGSRSMYVFDYSRLEASFGADLVAQ